MIDRLDDDARRVLLAHARALEEGPARRVQGGDGAVVDEKGRTLTPANPRDFAFAISYALRFGLTGKALGKRQAGDVDALVRNVVAHLARSNYVIFSGPPAEPNTRAEHMLPLTGLGDQA